MLQQRLVDRLTDYWDNIRKDNIYPDISLLNRTSIQDIWASCIVMQTQPSGANSEPLFKFQEVGSKARVLFEKDPTAEFLAGHAKAYPAARIMKRLPEMIQNPAPIKDDAQFVMGTKVVKFRCCMVPFGRDGKVTHVLVGLSWREF